MTQNTKFNLITCNQRIADLKKNNDIKGLRELKNKLVYESNFSNITPTERKTLIKKIAEIIDRISYESAIKIIASSNSPKEWNKYFITHNISPDSEKVFKKILQISQIRIKKALNQEKIDSISNYLKELRTFCIKDESKKRKLENTIIIPIRNYIAKTKEPTKQLAIINSFYDKGIVSNDGREYLYIITNKYEANLTKTALKQLDFKEALKYGAIEKYNLQPYWNNAVNEFKRLVRKGLINTVEVENAVKINVLKQEEASQLLKELKESRRAQARKTLRDNLIKAFLRDEEAFDSFVKSLKSNNDTIKIVLSEETLIIKNIRNNKLMSYEDLRSIQEEVERQTIVKQSEYQKYINNQNEQKQGSLIEEKTEPLWVHKIKPQVNIVRQTPKAQRPLTEDEKIIKRNNLKVINDIKGLTLGLALDLYTTKTSIAEDGTFYNEYSTLGEAIHNIKYANLSDDEKLDIIYNTIIPAMIYKTNYLSIWKNDLIIVPMPFTKERTMQPVYKIAEILAEKKNKKYNSNILYKHSTSESKYQEDDYEEGIFTATYNGGPISILIIDDTFGTGKSLRASIQALRKNHNIKNIYFISVVKNRGRGLLS